MCSIYSLAFFYLQQHQPGPHMVRHPSAHAMLPMCEAEEAAMQASLNAGK